MHCTRIFQLKLLTFIQQCYGISRLLRCCVANVAITLYLPADVVDSVHLLGSDNGHVLVLVNSLLLCRLAVDNDFDRLVLHDCTTLEMSFDPYDDDNLPQRSGLPVSFALRSPLLFAMNLDGITCILYHNNYYAYKCVELTNEFRTQVVKCLNITPVLLVSA